MDGGLSVIIGGVLSGTSVTGGTERVASVHGLEYESTLLGDGAASFWVEVLDPLSPQAAYPAGFPELLHGKSVIVRHTLNGTTTVCYVGYILTDPRSGYAGEKAIVEVECGGVLDVAKNRTDLGFIFTDTDESQWFANKRNPKCYSVDASDRIDIRVGDDTKVPHDKAGICGYVPYLGAEHLLAANGGPMTGVKRIKGTVSYDLRDNMNGALIWVAKYTPSLNATGVGSPYTVIYQFTTNTKADNVPLGPGGAGYTFGGANGAGYVALALWSNKAGGTKTTAERFIQIENGVLYTAAAEKTIDEAMLSVAGIVGLHTSTASSNIGAPLASLVARPYVDPVAALADFATQAEVLVEWGYHQGQFRARPLATHPLTIRALPNCYSVDPEDPCVVWDVTQHPENYIARAVRLIYGRIGKTAYPAGTPAQVISLDPGWTTGTAFMGGTSPVLTVDWSGKNLSSSRALTLARRLASHLGAGESSGSVSLTGVTVPVSSGGTRPVPYIHGGDWVECQKGGAGPLLITRAHVVVDTGYVDMDVGLADGLLLEQLIAAGLAGRKVDPMRPHHPRSFHPQASKERGNR